MTSYVCAHCAKPSSYQGHLVRFNTQVAGEDDWGFHCDPANNGKTYGTGGRERTVKAPITRRVSESVGPTITINLSGSDEGQS